MYIKYIEVNCYDSDIVIKLYDIICEILPYGGINIVDPGQTPRVWSGTTVVVAHKHLQRIVLSLPVQFEP